MKTLMITGGTGTLGNGLVERLLQENEYHKIRVLSRNEHAQSAMRRRFDNSRLRFVICDIRDFDGLRDAMRGCTHVIHAAALKDIHVAIHNPREVYKTNVLGSDNVVLAARDNRVQRCILTSTDKAYQPVSIYGNTKAIAERIFLRGREGRLSGDPLYSVVRYGNVWCSNGSVVPVWRDGLSRGIRPTVRNPACTRFFMLLGEAVDFVLAALKTMPEEPICPVLPAYDLKTLAAAMDIKDYKVGRLDPTVEKLHESMNAKLCSKDARRMSEEELRRALAKCGREI